jgi:hypothetical protein
MSRQTDLRYAELAKWFTYHSNTLPRENLAKRLDFLEKFCASALIVMAEMTRDIENLEGPRRKLYLPREIQVKGDVKQFG